MFCLGAWWLAWQGRQALDDWWPVTEAPSELWVEGIVWSLPVPTEQGQRFRFRLEQTCNDRPERCDVAGWSADSRLIQLNVYEPLDLQPGQRWRWPVRLRRPHGFSNPGGYDYEAWVLQQRVAALGYVRDTNLAQVLDQNSGHRSLERLRHRLLQALLSAGGDLPQIPLIIALTLGEGSRVAPEDWELFNRTGTTHLMVISGSHITLIAGLCLWLARRLWCLSARLPLWLPAPFAAAWAALFSAWFYTALAGFNLPAQRALVMSALTLGAVLLRRQTGLWQVLLVALTVILVWDPLAPQLPGFWLSFVAVAVLTLAVLRGGDSPSVAQRAWQLVRSQGYISIALMPLTGLLFQQVSWSAPLVNLIAIPLIGLIAVPLSLLCLLLSAVSPDLAQPVLQLASFALDLFLRGLRAFDALLPEPLLTLPRLLPLGVILLVGVTMALLLSKRWWQRGACLACMPLLLLIREPRLASDTVRVSVLDIGQGNAIVVSTRNHHLLYDTGPRYSDRFEAGSASVLPVLRYYGINRLERVIVSHGDSDHAGGIDSVLEAQPDALYQSSDPSLFPEDVANRPCLAGEQWEWDGVQFAMLSPSGAISSRNDGSCVLRIQVGTQVALLTGDIERAREHWLLQRGLTGPITVLLAPHHGSATSSSPAFLAALQPEHVVFTTAYLNRYRHPALRVVERYRQAGVREWYTMRSGALSFTLDARSTQPAIHQQRLERRRFWGEPLP